eukprot:4767632-Alexandrium_andersonii.AAC.1
MSQASPGDFDRRTPVLSSARPLGLGWGVWAGGWDITFLLTADLESKRGLVVVVTQLREIAMAHCESIQLRHGPFRGCWKCSHCGIAGGEMGSVRSARCPA